MKPRRDIYAIAVHRTVSLFDNVAHVNADPKGHAAITWHINAMRSQLSLYRKRCIHGADGGIKHSQDRIACSVDDTPGMSGNMLPENSARAIQCGNGGTLIK